MKLHIQAGIISSLLVVSHGASAPPPPVPYFVWDAATLQYVASLQPGNPNAGYYELGQSQTPLNAPSNNEYTVNSVTVFAEYDFEQGITLGVASEQEVEIHFIYEYNDETGEYSAVQGVPMVLPVTGASGTASDSSFYEYSFEPGFDGEHVFTIYWWVGYKAGHIALLPSGVVESTIQDGYWDYVSYTLRTGFCNWLQWWEV